MTGQCLEIVLKVWRLFLKVSGKYVEEPHGHVCNTACRVSDVQGFYPRRCVVKACAEQAVPSVYKRAPHIGQGMSLTPVWLYGYHGIHVSQYV